MTINQLCRRRSRAKSYYLTYELLVNGKWQRKAVFMCHGNGVMFARSLPFNLREVTAS